MKKSISSIIIMCLVTCLKAQVSGGTLSLPDLTVKGYQSISFPSGSIPAKITIKGWVNSSSAYGDIILQPGIIKGQETRNGSIRVNGSLVFPVYNNGDASISNISTGLSLQGVNGINFSAGNGKAMKIDSNGFVGIGTSKPQALFEINKTGSFCEHSNLRYIRFYPAKQVHFQIPCTDYETIETSSGIMQFIKPDGFGAHLMASNISGFKGTSPGNMTWQILESGDAFFGGKLTAREIEVKANVWADYVFKKDYKLLSISELESFINDHNRLPEVPSEAEVKDKGVNVGDMNALLLKKIEELTLYTIQQQKEIEDLKNDIRSLKK